MTIRVYIAAFAALAFLSGPAVAESFVFEGRVEASETAVLSSRLDGVVVEVLFSGGEAVSRGQPLIRLDPADAELALASADAHVARDLAALEVAESTARRQESLAERNVASEAALDQARAALKVARADLALAQAERRRAALDVERTIIRAPISGLVSRPSVSIGTFLEAEAGPPLATIVTIEPAVVAYGAPYADRLRAIAAANETTIPDLLSRLRVRIELPNGEPYGGTAVPVGASAGVDPQTGTITVWARFPNPEGLLRPGMTVTVHSELKTAVR